MTLGQVNENERGQKTSRTEEAEQCRDGRCVGRLGRHLVGVNKNRCGREKREDN